MYSNSLFVVTVVNYCLSKYYWKLVVILLFTCLLTFTEQRTTAQGQVYYFHAQSGVSSWHDPRVPRSV